jgi:catechol 2,3-dioxygenase-like lactoylglutathione lyase family enzyme
MAWTFLVPELPVRDVRAAQEWYRDVLGLGVNWLWEDTFGSVGQDGVELFPTVAPDRGPVTCCVFVDDVEAVYERCRERGADVCAELELKPWGVREFSVRDPDGNVFRIGRGETTTDDARFTVLDEVGA